MDPTPPVPPPSPTNEDIEFQLIQPHADQPADVFEYLNVIAPDPPVAAVPEEFQPPPELYDDQHAGPAQPPNQVDWVELPYQLDYDLEDQEIINIILNAPLDPVPLENVELHPISPNQQYVVLHPLGHSPIDLGEVHLHDDLFNGALNLPPLELDPPPTPPPAPPGSVCMAKARYCIAEARSA